MDKEVTYGDYTFKIYDNDIEKIKVFYKDERKQISKEDKEDILRIFKAKAKLLGAEEVIKKLHDKRDAK